MNNKDKKPANEISILKKKLVGLKSAPPVISNQSSGSIASSKGVAAGERGVAVGGNVKNIFIQNVVSKQSPKQQRETKIILKRYATNMVDIYQNLRLQGIRVGSQPISAGLEKVFIELRLMDKSVANEPYHSDFGSERRDKVITLYTAMARYQYMVILGDPGSGKSTLLAYIALVQARSLLGQTKLSKKSDNAAKTTDLPILIMARDFGKFLRTQHPDIGNDGPSLLISFLHEYYASQLIPLPSNFFVDRLENGHALVLVDGIDEIPDMQMRHRVTRLFEDLSVRYKFCRFIITCRAASYEGATRLSSRFGLLKILELSNLEIRNFIKNWTTNVEILLAGKEAVGILRMAEEQSERLINAVETNDRIADLATNPLLLTVIALVHRYRASLPERRSELYEEAVEVLLGQWDNAKRLDVDNLHPERQLDSGDRRSILEPVAFWLHENRQREIEVHDLRNILRPSFQGFTAGDDRRAEWEMGEFIKAINERSGLLTEKNTGVYNFVHLTFQEYLTARAIADREDSKAFTLSKVLDTWWRETILLEIGYLSTQGKRRVSELIRSILRGYPLGSTESYQCLLFVAECLISVGGARVEASLFDEVRNRLQDEMDSPFPTSNYNFMLQRIMIANSLGQLEQGQLIPRIWSLPWGEPVWVEIPEGRFIMGNDQGEQREKPQHELLLSSFMISKGPITNAQYSLFISDERWEYPPHWDSARPPKNLEYHPVTAVSWFDALNYCKWLSAKTGKLIRLPTESEWEKAAKGTIGDRQYTWGKDWVDFRCNSAELELNGTTPVGLFINGASPYGVLDMLGNVWEWCQSEFNPYPYDAECDKNPLDNQSTTAVDRVLRGGSYNLGKQLIRCSIRNKYPDNYKLQDQGFRVVMED